MATPVPPVPLASGRDAEVFALDDHRVLRRYRNFCDTASEAAAMAHAARHGYPVPEVHRAQGRELEMERLYGPTMLDASLDGLISPEESSRILAELHERLHALPGRKGSGQDRLLHMDLHPGNVVLAPRGPVVIDWTNARDGAPDLDLALTALLLALTGDSTDPPLAGLAEACLAPYVGHVKGDPTRLIDEVVTLRSDDPNLTPEEIALRPRAADLVRKAWAAQVH
ncbi:phosphotransferase [Nocardiopsis metallicus]|uniref:tRNA A-37 threonylcarbamoyl transferase component Bud32 n=1 Tax=Nocardiopsis metallicus TaxID=179819 RepID=A0A840WR83_9ACTN|nr:phosphotransferase [Nocardiopsis metallicus]MBB5494385.1 tRNA A-37 threonylcarbamoyl transferase component Bud32 [Nocardiopsis metallicus]